MGKPLNANEFIEKIVNRLLNYILDFELLLITWAGLVPSHQFRLLIYKMAGVKIGKGSRIHIGARFFNTENIKIGHGSIIGDNAFLDGRDKLVIGDNVDIASSVMIYNSEHNINSEDFHATSAPVEIEDYVFIGPRVTILPGVKIGKGAIVAAGAVVTKDVLEYFKTPRNQTRAKQPFKVLQLEEQIGASVHVSGGGINAQADAVANAIARAIVKWKEENKKKLRLAGLITRDSRMVERKKYGHHKARKSHQWSKR